MARPTAPGFACTECGWTGAKRLLDEPARRDDDDAPELAWSDERTVLALGWLAFGASAIAAVSIATQLFV